MAGRVASLCGQAGSPSYEEEQTMISTSCPSVLLISAAWITLGPTPGDGSDKDRIQGTWRVESATIAGKNASAEELKELQKDPMVFRGDKLVGRYEATFKLDPDKKPKEIDVTARTGKQQMTFRGIYRLDGDELTLCLSSVPNGERPAGFTLKDGDKAGTIVLKRMK
jgi:uncharacterized protein (TIGR03067 family)